MDDKDNDYACKAVVSHDASFVGLNLDKMYYFRPKEDFSACNNMDCHIEAFFEKDSHSIAQQAFGEDLVSPYTYGDKTVSLPTAVSTDQLHKIMSVVDEEIINNYAFPSKD